ncbi:MAG TPA: DegT/DnrJ/EryC1/StrS family aminotransferase [Acidobacteriaceae bacterium]|nr:DegT/DnrJ/EryC1/StrS family aminotransferase [Acidobacteriaceae bacterium]
MLDFARQYASIRGEILEAITRVCDSQAFILGPTVAAFEKSAAAACSTSFAVGCASGTDALWLQLAGAAIGNSTGSASADDAVLTTPFSFFASASAVIRAGARPIFADIDPRTLNLSPDSADEVLRGPAGERIRSILPVHLYGQCADFDALAQVAQSRGLLLLEDAAQAFGATWQGRPAGSLGIAAAFSFYPTKNLAAMGDAGLVTTSDAKIAERIRSLRTHGMTRRYYHDEIGWNARMDAIQAAVLEVKLRYLGAWTEERRQRAARYDDLFRAAGLVSSGSTAEGIVLPWTDPRAEHVFHQYVIRAPRRDALRAHLTQAGIGSEIYYPVPLHLQDALADLGYRPGDFPHAEAAAREVLALPLYPELRHDEQQAVVEAIRGFYA